MYTKGRYSRGSIRYGWPRIEATITIESSSIDAFILLLLAMQARLLENMLASNGLSHLVALLLAVLLVTHCAIFDGHYFDWFLT